jgi:beta-glucosidase
VPNPKGLDFYSRVVDELLDVGIEPFATLFHWDLPQTLQDRHGGWQSAETSKAFAEHAGYIAEQLGDRIKHIFTLNESRSFTDYGHQGMEADIGGGKTYRVLLAPALQLSDGELNQVRHHAVLAHGLAVQAIRGHGASDIKIGSAENMEVAVPTVDTAAHVKAAEAWTRETNAPFVTVMLGGVYTDAYLETAGADAPRFTDEELRTIAAPLDFVGINVYRPMVYLEPSDGPPGYRPIPINSSHPKMKSGWHILGPEVLYWGRATCSHCGARSRSTSPRTGVRPTTRPPAMAASTTRIGSCSCGAAWGSCSAPRLKACPSTGTSSGSAQTTSSGGTAFATGSG